MKEHTRNVLVGLTVLVALVMLGTMIVLFAGLPEMFRRGRVLRMQFDETGDMQTGDWVHLAGVRVGKITDIAFADRDPRRGVEMVARIDEGVRIPADVQPRIYTGALVRGGYLLLASGGPERFDPKTGAKLDFLPKDWSQPLRGTRKAPQMLPEDLLDGLRGLSKLAGTLNDLLAGPAPPATATAPGATQPAPARVTIRATLSKLGRALDALDAVLGDPNTQADIKASMAGLAKATAKAGDAMDALKQFARESSKTAEEARKAVAEARRTIAQAGKAADKFGHLADRTDRRIEQLSEKLIDDAEQLSKLLSSINRVATKIDAGKGTVGQLLNDPKLYNDVLDATDRLSRLLKEARELFAQWKKHGVPLKIK